MNVIGLKKCPKCGFKDLYGCHNYYTIGAPFICPKCGSEMDYLTYCFSTEYASDEVFNKIWNHLKENLEKLDYAVTEKRPGEITVKWIGLPSLNEGKTKGWS